MFAPNLVFLCFLAFELRARKRSMDRKTYDNVAVYMIANKEVVEITNTINISQLLTVNY